MHMKQQSGFAIVLVVLAVAIVGAAGWSGWMWYTVNYTEPSSREQNGSSQRPDTSADSTEDNSSERQPESDAESSSAGATPAERDTRRSNDTSVLSSSIEQYAANNYGQYPGENAFNEEFLSEYAPDLYREGWERAGSFQEDCGEQAPRQRQVHYSITSDNRDYALKVCLENGEDVLKEPS